LPGRNSQIARIYALLNLLEGCSAGLSVAELTDQLKDRGHDATQRTIRRDVEALEDAGFPLVQIENSQPKNVVRWGLQSRTRISGHLILNSRELLALYLARGVLRPLCATPFYADLAAVFSKLESHLGEKGRSHLDELSEEIHFEPGPRWGLGVDPDLLDTVQASCVERHVLSVIYDSASSSSKRSRTLGPHFLYFAKGSLYLVAEDLQTGENKIFSVARMTEAQMLDEGYVGETVDPEEFFKASFGIFKGTTPVQIRIEISPKIAPFVKERRWHSSQSVISKGDGSIVLGLDVAITPELVQWILGFGEDAKVIEPNQLRKEIAEAATKVAALYEKPRAA